MWSRFAIVREPTATCDFGLYFNDNKDDPAECYASGKYALIDLTDPIGHDDVEQLFFCVAHLCPEHALGVLTKAHDNDILADRKRAKEIVGRYDAKELGTKGQEEG